MNKIKTGLIGGLGIIGVIVTFRALRKRRANRKEETATAVEAKTPDEETALEHATAAAEHARVALKKATESGSEKPPEGE